MNTETTSQPLSASLLALPSEFRDAGARIEIFDAMLGNLEHEPDGPALVFKARGGGTADFIPLTDDEIRIGRQPLNDQNPNGCQLAFPDQPKMSGRHFRISIEGDDYVVEDLDSKNGTYLAGLENRRIQKRILCPGDILLAGDMVFAFQGRSDDADFDLKEGH